MIDAQERYLTAVSRMVKDYCRGGEVPLDDEAKAKLRQDHLHTATTGTTTCPALAP
jgi:hypothetical protein